VCARAGMRVRKHVRAFAQTRVFVKENEGMRERERTGKDKSQRESRREKETERERKIHKEREREGTQRYRYMQSHILHLKTVNISVVNSDSNGSEVHEKHGSSSVACAEYILPSFQIACLVDKNENAIEVLSSS